jgi:hypothetical protein
LNSTAKVREECKLLKAVDLAIRNQRMEIYDFDRDYLEKVEVNTNLKNTTEKEAERGITFRPKGNRDFEKEKVLAFCVFLPSPFHFLHFLLFFITYYILGPK